MAFDSFDSGPQGSSGPWLNWTARGTQCGTIPARSFYVNDKDKVKTITEAFSHGVVLDIEKMKTGWCEDTPTGPKWTLGASPSALPVKPSDTAKKGFNIPCALSPEEKADWNQAGAGAFGAFVDLAPALVEGSKASPGKLPVVKLATVKDVKFSNGMTTAQPVFEILKWADRPPCLQDDAGGFDTGEPAPQATQPAPSAPSAPTTAPAGGTF